MSVLHNYEERTGEVLNPSDLTEKRLLDKLIPADYDIKSKVSGLPFLYNSLCPPLLTLIRLAPNSQQI